MKKLIKREPAVTAGISVGVIALALVNLLAAFVVLTPDQQTALTDVAVLVLPVLATVAARFFVKPAKPVE